MKKIITIILVLALVAAVVVGLVACKKGDTTEDTSVSFAAVAKDDIKFGLITLHDENSTYDKNFIDAAKQAIKDLGLKDSQLIIKSALPSPMTATRLLPTSSVRAATSSSRTASVTSPIF